MLSLLILIRPCCLQHSILPSFHSNLTVLSVRHLLASLYNMHSYTKIQHLHQLTIFLQMVPRLPDPSLLIYIDIHRVLLTLLWIP